MSSRRFVFIAASATALAPLALPADPALPEEQIVVTATRVPVPLQEVLVPVLVIDRDAIERSGAADPGDILRFHAGLELGRNGGPGQTTAVFMRGADSNHTLVLVDGVRINPGTIGLAALQSIDTANIERIEVVKGPRSALYGTDAIGGVINVITRRGTDSGWAAEVGYGDYDTTSASLSGGFTSGKTEFDFGAAWTDSQGFPTRTTDDVDRGFHNLNTTAQLRTGVGAADVSLSYWRADGTTEYSDFFLAPVDQDFANSTTTIRRRFSAGRGAPRQRDRESFRRQGRAEPDARLPDHEPQQRRCAVRLRPLGRAVAQCRRDGDPRKYRAGTVRYALGVERPRLLCRRFG